MARLKAQTDLRGKAYSESTIFKEEKSSGGQSRRRTLAPGGGDRLGDEKVNYSRIHQSRYLPRHEYF